MDLRCTSRRHAIDSRLRVSASQVKNTRREELHDRGQSYTMTDCLPRETLRSVPLRHQALESMKVTQEVVSIAYTITEEKNSTEQQKMWCKGAHTTLIRVDNSANIKQGRLVVQVWINRGSRRLRLFSGLCSWIFPNRMCYHGLLVHGFV